MDAPWPPRPWYVPICVLWDVEPLPDEDWRRMGDPEKAQLGKLRFLEHPSAVEATPALIREWLQSHGLDVGAEWAKIVCVQDLAPRYVNVGYSPRCIDAFLRKSNDELEGVELKVSGSDGVSGLTVSEERLLRAGLIRVLAVNPVRGLIGEFDADALLNVPRRIDGIPVGRVVTEWKQCGA